MVIIALCLGTAALSIGSGCASDSSGRSRDPLADEDFARTSQGSPPSRRKENGEGPFPETSRPTEGEYAPRRAPMDSSQPRPAAPVPENLNDLYTHRPNMCVDGRRYINNGEQYRQGCMLCTCEADSVRERINCMEIPSCHTSKKQERPMSPRPGKR